jgi:OmpA-OmpF porin, OOP family
MASLAAAQDRPITLQLFQPALDSKGYFTQNASQVLGHLETSFGLVASWAKNPLELRQTDPACPAGNPECRSFVVENLSTLQGQAALGLFGRFELSLSVPLTIWSGDADPSPDGQTDTGSRQGQGLADLILGAKVRILATSTHPVGLAVVASLAIPTGGRDQFLGEGQPVLSPGVIVDKDLLADRLHLALNLGARLRPQTRTFDDFASAPQGTPGSAQVQPRACPDPDPAGVPCGTGKQVQVSRVQATYGLGFSYAVVLRRFDFVAEAYGTADPAADSDVSMFPLEALAGFKVYLAKKSYLGFGGGAGVDEAWGSPDARVFGMFVYEPSIGDRDGDGIKDDVDQCPDDPEDLDGFEDADGCPDPDNDRDGILDRDDLCPNEPEDKDGQDDADGCPEPDLLDRDGDGILDDDDACPDDPEDKDGFQDADGCPDPDNDKDGIPDIADACPDDPEDHDGFEDEDGCPDPDNDKDRILDVVDKCPNEPETYNGFEDEDGCPDRGRVIVRRGAIEILDKIYFETNKAVIKEISFPLLDAIAATLKGNPQILLVEIQGHADERAPDEYNMRLTDARAHSVMTYLLGKGVEPARIQATGYGETRPVCKEHNEACWSKNRRVEFVIQKRADEGMK